MHTILSIFYKFVFKHFDIQFILIDIMVEGYSKYLISRQTKENEWITIENVGYTKIPPHTEYPPLQHPEAYALTWEKGRKLQEFQLVYITNGCGVLETKNTGITRVEPGTVFLLLPGVWHRYKPDENIGWNEYWVGFRGRYAEMLIDTLFIKNDLEVVKMVDGVHLLSLFTELFATCREEKIGFEHLAAGITCHLITLVHHLSQLTIYHNSLTERLVKQAKEMMVKNLTGNIQGSDIANELNVSYSLLRKVFKQYTGYALNNYYIRIKLSKAREELLYTQKSINQIADELGFANVFYFTRLFKEKIGKNPGEFRANSKL
jgi:AraC-like DNA-binding protein